MPPFKSVCTTKLTKIQIPDTDWACPKCGAKGPDTSGPNDKPFVIEDSACEVEDCEKLHEADFLLCENCGFETNGKAYVTGILKRTELVKCPACKGTGMIRKTAKTARSKKKKKKKK